MIWREYTTSGVEVKESFSFSGGITVIDRYRYHYVNANGEPVATHELSFINAERQALKDKGRNKDIQRASYTPQDIERIDALMLRRKCAAATRAIGKTCRSAMSSLP